MKLTAVCIVLVLCMTSVWARDKKRCFCKAVDASNGNKVYKDFGAINEHSHWLSVGCKRLNRCSDNCARRVNDWLCDNSKECMKAAKGNMIRHQYKGSICNAGTGTLTKACGCSGGKFDDLHKCQFKCFSSTNVMGFIACFNQCFQGRNQGHGGRISAAV